MPRKVKSEDLRAACDKTVSQLVNKHGLQGLMESLRRVVDVAVTETRKEALNSHEHSKWKSAFSIIAHADNALYGQHCGDVPLIRTGR